MKKKPKGHPYRCPACKKIIYRESEKQWIRSYCEIAGRFTRIQRVKEDVK